MNGLSPLISVVVLTYNSSDYIIETLESIKNQDYPNLEIIVSDDGSVDRTCPIVSDWIENNKDLFKRALLIKSFKNRGICHNYNQGVFNSQGVYIKTIDGDDCLNGADAISKYVTFVLNNNVEICISDVKLFSTDNFDMTHYRETFDFYYRCVDESFEQQRSRIVDDHCLPDPALFFSRKLYDEVNGFDESYVLLEEWPFFFNVLNKGYKVYGIPEQLVQYRIHAKSVSHNKKNKANTLIQKDLLKFYWKVRLKEYLKNRKYAKAVYHALYAIKCVLKCYV